MRQGRYYASRTNDFWRILTVVTGRDLLNATYKERVQLLRALRIGLWDVFHHAFRPGSDDSNIQNEELNEFTSLATLAPELRQICFNGKKAGKSRDVLQNLGYVTIVLPSSSGANRRDQAARLEAWRVALKGAI